MVWKLDLFHPQLRRMEIPQQGNRYIFQNDVFSNFLEYWTVDEVQTKNQF
jgi:hypothetical protein